MRCVIKIQSKYGVRSIVCIVAVSRVPSDAGRNKVFVGGEGRRRPKRPRYGGKPGSPGRKNRKTGKARMVVNPDRSCLRARTLTKYNSTRKPEDGKRRKERMTMHQVGSDYRS